MVRSRAWHGEHMSYEPEWPNARTTARWSIRFIVASVIVLLLLVAFASMWLFGWGFFARATADFRGETAQRERVLADPDYRIANYDWFFNQCASVQTQEGLIAQLEAELADSATTEGRKAQLRATLTAVRANRLSLINDYNSRAAREDTAANFRASNLPPTLDREDTETTCAAEPQD